MHWCFKDESNYIFDVPNCFRLKEFSTIIEWNLFNPHAIYDFFTYQSELEKIQLCLWNSAPNEDPMGEVMGDPITLKALLFHILKHCRKLKDLHFQFFCDGMQFNSEEFSEFLIYISHLESLTLVSKKSVLLLDDLCPSKLPSTKYIKLRELRLEGLDKRISFEILNRCRNSLRSLFLSSVDDEIMQKILETHVRLCFLMYSEKIYGCY